MSSIPMSEKMTSSHKASAKKGTKTDFQKTTTCIFLNQDPIYIYMYIYIYGVSSHLYYFIKPLQHHQFFPFPDHAAQFGPDTTSMPFRGHQFPRRSDAALVTDGNSQVTRRWYAYLEPLCPLFLVVEPYKTRSLPIKTRVIWVPGIYIYTQIYGIYYSIWCILYIYTSASYRYINVLSLLVEPPNRNFVI